MSDTRNRPFDAGNIHSTPGAMKACGPRYILACLGRHMQGDWGCVDIEDQATNDDALEHGGRLLSAYPINEDQPCKGWGENTLWVITEADRSATTFLLPDEY